MNTETKCLQVPWNIYACLGLIITAPKDSPRASQTAEIMSYSMRKAGWTGGDSWWFLLVMLFLDTFSRLFLWKHCQLPVATQRRSTLWIRAWWQSGTDCILTGPVRHRSGVKRKPSCRSLHLQELQPRLSFLCLLAVQHYLAFPYHLTSSRSCSLD